MLHGLSKADAVDEALFDQWSIVIPCWTVAKVRNIHAGSKGTQGGEGTCKKAKETDTDTEGRGQDRRR